MLNGMSYLWSNDENTHIHDRIGRESDLEKRVPYYLIHAACVLFIVVNSF